ncbi:hypothetical protein ACFLIM_36465 [Nonomuraea sp. M3C6]|uniref:Uncharacterized protein n=1 Tax=Nonomuraea marmarensis TaxID=3351344 RepID=A0ABW7AMX0_9ACTN
MGLEVFLTRYIDGEETKIDSDRLQEMLREFTIEVNGKFRTLRARDSSEAEVYIGDEGDCSFNDSTGGEIDEFMIRVAREFKCALVPSYGPVMVLDEAQRRHLPERFSRDAVVIESAADLEEIMATEYDDEDE